MFIIGLLLGAAVMIFVLQNITTVTISFLAWQFDASLSLIILLSVVAGMLIGAVLSLPELMRKNSIRTQLEKHNRQLVSELEAHKEALAATEASHIQTETPVVIERTTTVVGNDQPIL